MEMERVSNLQKNNHKLEVCTVDVFNKFHADGGDDAKEYDSRFETVDRIPPKRQITLGQINIPQGFNDNNCNIAEMRRNSRFHRTWIKDSSETGLKNVNKKFSDLEELKTPETDRKKNDQNTVEDFEEKNINPGKNIIPAIFEKECNKPTKKSIEPKLRSTKMNTEHAVKFQKTDTNCRCCFCRSKASWQTLQIQKLQTGACIDATSAKRTDFKIRRFTPVNTERTKFTERCFSATPNMGNSPGRGNSKGQPLAADTNTYEIMDVKRFKENSHGRGNSKRLPLAADTNTYEIIDAEQFEEINVERLKLPDRSLPVKVFFPSEEKSLLGTWKKKSQEERKFSVTKKFSVPEELITPEICRIKNGQTFLEDFEKKIGNPRKIIIPAIFEKETNNPIKKLIEPKLKCTNMNTEHAVKFQKTDNNCRCCFCCSKASWQTLQIQKPQSGACIDATSAKGTDFKIRHFTPVNTERTKFTERCFSATPNMENSPGRGNSKRLPLTADTNTCEIIDAEQFEEINVERLKLPDMSLPAKVFFPSEEKSLLGTWKKKFQEKIKFSVPEELITPETDRKKNNQSTEEDLEKKIGNPRKIIIPAIFEKESNKPPKKPIEQKLKRTKMNTEHAVKFQKTGKSCKCCFCRSKASWQTLGIQTPQPGAFIGATSAKGTDFKSRYLTPVNTERRFSATPNVENSPGKGNGEGLPLAADTNDYDILTVEKSLLAKWKKILKGKRKNNLINNTVTHSCGTCGIPRDNRVTNTVDTERQTVTPLNAV